MGHGSWVMGHGSWVMGHGFSVMGHRSSVIGHLENSTSKMKPPWLSMLSRCSRDILKFETGFRTTSRVTAGSAVRRPPLGRRPYPPRQGRTADPTVTRIARRDRISRRLGATGRTRPVSIGRCRTALVGYGQRHPKPVSRSTRTKHGKFITACSSEPPESARGRSSRR